MSLERNIKKRIIKKQKGEIPLDNNTLQRKEINEQEVILEKQGFETRNLASIDELSEIEKDVLNIAEKIFKSSKYDNKFNIETKQDLERYPIIGQLYSNSISKLHYSKGYTKEELFLAIRNLEKEGWIVSEERRTKSEILNDKNYKKIIEFIKKNPGVHALDPKVEEELEITRSPFLKRVITLLHYNIIRAHKIGKIVHFFLIDTPPQYDKLKALFLNPLIPKLIKEISKDKFISGIQLGKILNEPVHKIHYYLKKIKELEIIIRKKENSGRKGYFLNKNLLSNYNEIFKEPRFSGT
ncbi:MAG: hypothetical protein ACFE9Z_01175 [Promethearchaeota archaeon]